MPSVDRPSGVMRDLIFAVLLRWKYDDLIMVGIWFLGDNFPLITTAKLCTWFQFGRVMFPGIEMLDMQVATLLLGADF